MDFDTEPDKTETTYRNFIHFPRRQDELTELTEDLKFKTGLVEAIRDSDGPLIHKYLGQAQDVNFIDKRGAGPMHYAVTHCDLPLLDVLQRLIQTGADVNLITYEGDNALNLLIKTQEYRNRDDMVAITSKLLDWGAEVNCKDMDKRDAVDLARMKNYNDVLRLVEKYKSPNSSRLKTFRDMVPPNHAEVDFLNTTDWDRGERPTYQRNLPNKNNAPKTTEEYKPLTDKEKEIVQKVRNRKKRSGESCSIL